MRAGPRRPTARVCVAPHGRVDENRRRRLGPSTGKSHDPPPKSQSPDGWDSPAFCESLFHGPNHKTQLTETGLAAAASTPQPANALLARDRRFCTGIGIQTFTVRVGLGPFERCFARSSQLSNSGASTWTPQAVADSFCRTVGPIGSGAGGPCNGSAAARRRRRRRHGCTRRGRHDAARRGERQRLDA